MTTPQSAQKQSKSQEAYNWIREKIRTREYEPGHRLVLSTVAEELGVSVVPVREAIRQLEAEGMVTYERNVGARVTTRNREAYFDTMHIIAALEGLATALSAPHLTQEDIAKARALNAEMMALDVHTQPDDFTRLNKDFHRVLFSRCPNRHLVDLLLEQWEVLEFHRVSTFRYVPERAAASRLEHQRILQLIEAQADADYLEKVCRQHRMTTAETYISLLQRKD